MDYQIETIETKRLFLRPVRAEDAEDMHAYASRNENVHYLSFAPHESIEHTKEIIQTLFLSKPEKRMPESWAIVHKGEGRMIGTIDFHALNKRTKEAEVGYVLNSDYWNEGYMTEALKAVITFGFRTFQLNTIRAKCHPLNLASSKVMGKAGMAFLEVEEDAYGQIEALVYEIENPKQTNRKGGTHNEKTRKKI